jgi:glycerol uptake facilitator-like aquaporin
MHKLLVEFLGTLLLVFVVLSTGHWAAIGLALAVAVFLGGNISGGAFNPAVAVSFLLKKSITANECVMYIIAELLAAAVAFLLYQNTKKYLKF